MKGINKTNMRTRGMYSAGYRGAMRQWGVARWVEVVVHGRDGVFCFKEGRRTTFDATDGRDSV